MLRILLALILITTPALAEWDKDIPLSADNLTDFPVDNQENLDRLELVLREYPRGITLSYTSASTITASTGGIVCADSTGVTKKFRGNTSTTAITFSDLDTGVEASSTTYYVYANCDASATTATFKISLSSTTPSGVTSYKRIGSFFNNSSSDIGNIVNDNSLSYVGVATSKTFGVQYQAATDGFIVATANSNSINIRSGQNTSGMTQFCTQTSDFGVTCSIVVRKGDYWQSDATASLTLYFTPLGT